MIIWNAIKWALGQLWEKVNVVETYRELVELGKKYGIRFFIAAFVWEIIEDVVFPLIAWQMGAWQLAPLFWIFHFEPIVYPAFFWGFKQWDIWRGYESPYPDRPAQSSYMRTTLKVAVYEAAIFFSVLGAFHVLGLSLGLATAFILLMGFFNFIHERIWHDSNYGIIIETDMVEPKRNLAKTFTFRLVSVVILGTALYALVKPFPWAVFIAFESTLTVVYLGLETMWSQSAYGIGDVPETET